MDAPQYLIRKIETCPECKGEKFFYNPEWAELNEEHDRRCRDMTPNDRFTEFGQMVREKWPWGEPPEEEPCAECEGTGKIETWIPLEQALHELGYYRPTDWDPIKERFVCQITGLEE